MTDHDVQQAQTSAPIACDLSVFTAAEREAHIERARRLRRAMRGCEMTSDGVKISFDSSVAPDEVLAFAADEQRCCVFLCGASGAHEPTPHGEAFVLKLRSNPDAGSAWIAGFMALCDDV